MNNSISKVLIVDDESGVRYALSEALKTWGYETVEAATVADGVKKFEEEQPAVAIPRR